MSRVKRIQYRFGVPKRTGPTFGRMPRSDGAPLLFGGDVRMRILAALAGRTSTRVRDLRRALHPSVFYALGLLSQAGLVVKWSGPGKAAFVALDPAHPAFHELGELMTKVRALYPSYAAATAEEETELAGTAPCRPSRRRDVRFTFGDPIVTLTLLVIHVLGEAWKPLLVQCLPFSGQALRHTLYKFRAFGLLSSVYAKRRNHRALVFSFNEAHPLTREVRAVLSALDRRSPLWGIRARRALTERRPAEERRTRGPRQADFR